MAAETMLFSKSWKKAKIGFAVQQRSTSLLNALSYPIFFGMRPEGTKWCSSGRQAAKKMLQRSAQPQMLELMNEFWALS